MIGFSYFKVYGRIRGRERDKCPAKQTHSFLACANPSCFSFLYIPTVSSLLLFALYLYIHRLCLKTLMQIVGLAWEIIVCHPLVSILLTAIIFFKAFGTPSLCHYLNPSVLIVLLKDPRIQAIYVKG